MKPKKRTNLDLHACYEVQVHYKRPLFNDEKKITCSQDAAEVLRQFSDPKRIDHKEFFWLILLATNANQVIGISELSMGSTRGVIVNYKEILQLAILVNASAVIVAHNHCSGKLEPSKADQNATRELKRVVRILEIDLIDHIILTSEDYFSFCDQGLL